jgi:hypothetical protein
MSDIPKNKRSPSKLEAIHQAFKIRTMITNELILTFGYNERREDEHIAKATSYIKDKDQRSEQQHDKLSEGGSVLQNAYLYKRHAQKASREIIYFCS